MQHLHLRQVTFVLATICIVLVLAIPKPKPQMTDAQLEQTLGDRATMIRHLKCATGEGACDPVGRRLRSVQQVSLNLSLTSARQRVPFAYSAEYTHALAPLVLRGACPQCSAQETNQIRRTLAHIQRNYPWEWAKIVRQYG